MELVVCRCKKCRNTIGKFINLWMQVNEKGFSPIIRSDDNLTPIIFRATSVILSNDAGDRVKCAIVRFLSYNKPAITSKVGSTENQGAQGTDSNTPSIANTVEKAVDGARESLTKLLETTVENCILEVRKGFDDLASFKIEVHNLKNVQHRQITLLNGRLDFVSSEPSQTHNEATESTNQVQQELTDLRSQVSDLQNQINILTPKANNSVPVTDYANEIATLRTETADLRQLLDNTRSYNTERSFPSRELDILTSSIAKIGNRASHVETLQMEFEILKGRMERVFCISETDIV
ncbi:hypothetical protein B0T09DRAFT_411389 [Sordaria sp. MPI-SDFR-AT-0083]|nr:hypothetical protein B0T09DRAFT_411389 [Sordaria sp. MPI-SDFR-AT-0083]